MKITDLLITSRIDLNGRSATKENTIDSLAELMYSSGVLNDKEEYKAKVLEREKEGTTGIGEGVAIPHAKTSAVKEAALAAMVIKEGTEFDSLDGQKVNLIFMIAAPEDAKNLHLDVLGKLSVLLMDESFRQKLINSSSPEEFLSIIDKADSENEEEKKQDNDGYVLLGVTACPTGIAHTYMAAESLLEKSAQKGIKMKVETNGSSGVKNRLTNEEIKNAKAIIVAADTEVETARFDGKRVIMCSVADGINKADSLIEKAMSDNVSVYHASKGEKSGSSEDSSKQSVGRQIYKHLMNGVSHMLPFVIGGGILIALAFLADTILAPNGPADSFGKNTAISMFLKGSVGEVAFGFMLPVLAGYIAMSIGDRPALAVGFVGGMMAHLGGAGFLGALVAGFLAGYIIVLLKKICSYLPDSLEGIKPVLIYPLLGIFIIGLLMEFVINPPVSFLNGLVTKGLEAMGSTSKVLLGIVLAGMMAVDMGGPINKAAYVFGTASLLVGTTAVSSSYMAAVMIGGMVPPLAIALCATFFKNRFTRKDRQSAFVNYIMGLSFITEGAIPFAAADPLRVIPSCVVGSAVAGGLSMLFGCSIPAPHGGLFVIPVVQNPLMYVVALIAGSLVGMLMLALLKKPIKEKD